MSLSQLQDRLMYVSLYDNRLELLMISSLLETVSTHRNGLLLWFTWISFHETGILTRSILALPFDGANLSL